MRATTTLTLAALMTLGTQAFAQECLGLPDMSRMTRNITTTGLGRGPDRVSLTRFGITRGNVFAGVQGGLSGSGFGDPNSALLGADVGYAIRMDRVKLGLCPQLQSTYRLSERRYGFQQHEVVSAFGASMGRAINFGEKFALVPFVQGGLVHQYYNVAGSSTIGTTPISPSQKRLGGQFGVGFGMRFGQYMSLRPSFNLTPGDFRLGSNEPSYGVAASYSLRRAKGRNQLENGAGSPNWKPMGGAKGLGGRGTRRLPPI